MTLIGCNHFLYGRFRVYCSRRIQFRVRQNKTNSMKTSRLTYALIATGLVAGLALVANVRAGISVESLAGFGLAVGLVGLIAIEYGFGARRALRR